MRRFFVFASVTLMVVFLCLNLSLAKDIDRSRLLFRVPDSRIASENTSPGQYLSFARDTFNIVRYDFEPLDLQGWVRTDNTGQPDTFFHADDFSGLSGGDFGKLYPLSGAKSMWCGARPDTSDPYLCSWVNAPGYGNGWEQILRADAFDFAGSITLSARVRYDTEADFDFVYIEYIDADSGWKEIASFCGTGDTSISYNITPKSASTKLRFRFESDGAWSDQDGLYNSDGAVIIDDITISDIRGQIDYEDFESWTPGATSDENSLWRADVPESFGTYSGLWHGLKAQDPCDLNLSTQIVFFVGSTEPSSEYPGLYDTPHCKGEGGVETPCQEEYILSPLIDVTKYSTNRDEIQDADIPADVLPELGGILLYFTVYRDLPLQNLVFYHWKVLNIDENGCPVKWEDRDFVYYGTDGYYRSINEIGDLVTEDRIQVALGIRDLCWLWYLSYGDCSEHTPSPWFDNVEIRRYSLKGPQWYYRSAYLFQDNFPSATDIESFIRADMANDLNPKDDPMIRPGDSLVVTCTSPIAGGLAVDNGLPAIYMHVRVHYIGDPAAPKPDLAGASLEGTYGRYVSDDGEWTIIQGDTARTSWGYASDRYAFDLNDSLFTRGYEISYYFRAVDLDGESSTLPRDADKGVYFEWTCLPTLRSDILYVDDYDGRGTFDGRVQQYFDRTFSDVLPVDNQPDRYDVNAPTSLLSNGPASRGRLEHFLAAYKKVIWDSGNLDTGTICDGTTDSDKSDDCTLLVNWMDQSSQDVGLWILGDDVAYDFANHLTSTQSADLMQNWCGVQYVANSYYDVTGGRVAGGVVTPLVKGSPGSIFVHGGVPDSFYVFGGCPIINAFDCLGKGTNAAYALEYPPYGGTNYYAGVQNQKVNSIGYNARTMWFGFSFMYIRDAEAVAPIIRNHIFKDVIDWFQNTTNTDITGTETPAAYGLAQNFPNPFNPSTTIRFDMKAKGHVAIKVYNVAGQLVRTLVDGVYDAGTHSVTWDGTNNIGAKVASGVYFYKMETKNFSQTKKMVMLR